MNPDEELLSAIANPARSKPAMDLSAPPIFQPPDAPLPSPRAYSAPPPPPAYYPVPEADADEEEDEEGSYYEEEEGSGEEGSYGSSEEEPSPPRRRDRDRYRERHDEEIRQSVKNFKNFKKESSREDEIAERVELLARLSDLERSGYRTLRPIDDATPIDVVRFELYRVTRDQRRDTSLTWMRKALITLARLVEIANAKYNPLELNLKGFSRSLQINIADFDSPLLGLHSIYSNRSFGMHPGLQLGFAFISSAVVHHATAHTEETTDRKLTNTGKTLHSLAGVASVMRPSTSTTTPARVMRGPPESP